MKKRATSFDDLPHDLAVFIISRLPVKTLIRSSTVSKTWYSLIKNPNFVSAQIRRSISCCNENAVLIIPSDIRYEKYCSLISADTGCVFDKYEIPFNTKTGTLKLVGSVNGLLCFTEKYIRFRNADPYPGKDLYMWNPSVRKYKSICTSSFRKRYARGVEISYAVGFGFHEPSCDYKVVRIMYFKDEKGNQVEKLTPRVEVFSLRNNKWRPWRVINNTIVPRVAYRIGTTVNSTVYWVKERSSKKYSEEMWILSFDFNTQVFGQLKLPDDVPYSFQGAARFQLMKFEGSLCVCVLNDVTEINGIRTQPCCIWLINHEDGMVSSTIRYRVVLENFGVSLNITKSGALITASRSFGNTNTLSWNLKSMRYKTLESRNTINNNQPDNVDTFFIESLGGAELLKSICR